MNRERFEQRLCELPIAQYAFFRTAELTFSPRIRHVCKHECPRYGKSWACPPAVGTVDECRARCLAHASGLLIATLAEVDDITNMELTLATRPQHEDITHTVDRLLRDEGVTPLVLSTDSCARCARCTYPDAPCRHPALLYPCIESHGIVVTDLAERLGVAYHYGGNIVTWFSLLLFSDGD